MLIKKPHHGKSASHAAVWCQGDGVDNYKLLTLLLGFSDIHNLCIVIKICQSFVLGNKTTVFRVTQMRDYRQQRTVQEQSIHTFVHHVQEIFRSRETRRNVQVVVNESEENLVSILCTSVECCNGVRKLAHALRIFAELEESFFQVTIKKGTQQGGQYRSLGYAHNLTIVILPNLNEQGKVNNRIDW